jgi:hypothetical protein
MTVSDKIVDWWNELPYATMVKVIKKVSSRLGINVEDFLNRDSISFGEVLRIYKELK